MTLLASSNHPINCGLATTTFARTFSKRSIADRKFDIVATESRRATASAGESTVAINKTGGTSAPYLKNVLRKTGATYATDYLVNASIRGEGYFQPITLTSENTAVLGNPSTAGVATYQSGGQCTLRAESADGEVSLVRVTASQTSPATVDTFQSWATGSMAKHCVDQIDGLIAGKTQLNLYTDYQYYGTAQSNTFARNSACWANGIDLSCASPWNSANGALYAGTLVSPRHVVFCEHSSFYPPNGATMYFSSPSGNVISRTLTGSVHAGAGIDIRIGVLNADVDGGVTFAKVLPSTYANYLPGLGYDATAPVICLNQTERASISGLRQIGSQFANTYPAGYADYYRDIVRFDSGNPCFLVVSGGPVLLGVFTGGGPGSGLSIAYHATAVNSAMTTLGGGYQLTAVDLSGFTNYS